jgi:hypothetical protein
MHAKNKKAEEKYYELVKKASEVSHNLLKVINLELSDENELNSMLDKALSDAKKIGMRGEIIDIGYRIKMARDTFLQEMENKTNNSDEEDGEMLDLNDDDKILNVYDEKYDKYLH